jgi:hypothetical protein
LVCEVRPVAERKLGMLIYENKTANKELQELLRSIVGEQSQHAPFELPNLKESTDAAFWNYRSCWTFDAEAWTGTRKIGDEWATVILYFITHGHFKNGGFAVAHFYNRKDSPVKYWTFAQCVHEYKSQSLGNCYHRYTCAKCGSSYEVDSSD